MDGDTSDITKRYLRESVTQMLEEYPDLDGIGVSHGEGMAGMTPLERQQFVDEVYVAGALEAKRKQPVKLIHRVPFSSGLSSGPGRQRGRRAGHARRDGETRRQVRRARSGRR